MLSVCYRAYVLQLLLLINTLIRSLPEMEGLSKETVFTSWMAKFDCILKGKLCDKTTVIVKLYCNSI